MEILTVLGVIGFVFRLCHKLSGLLFLWWRKEYRLDRMLIHLRTKQGCTIWAGKTHVALIFLLLSWLVLPFRDIVYALIAVGAFVIGMQYLRSFRSWLLPPVSSKVMAILVATMFVAITVTQLGLFPILVSLLIVDLTLFPLTTMLVWVVSFPTSVYHRFVIHKAMRLLASHKPMTVIGITGSYGKTSVKDYLATILSTSYKTLKTEASKNAPIGIAEVILRSLRPSHQVFVFEMGAYKRGEITEMTQMVHPEIGILTAINPQHQDLFGTIENTVRAKYELVEGLVGRRIVIANADDPNVVNMGKRAEASGYDVRWFSRTKNVANIASDVSGVAFDCFFDKQKAHVRAKVLGEHQVANILASLAGAMACGMRLADAAKAASAILPADHVMELTRGVHGGLFIDDTFNNNPDAAIAALTFLGKLKGQKIVVFQPMIELGNFAQSAHESVGRVAARYADAIFLTNSNYFESFKRGVRSVSKTVPLSVATAPEIASYIRTHAKQGDTVLFKGKDAEHALCLLTH